MSRVIKILRLFIRLPLVRTIYKKIRSTLISSNNQDIPNFQSAGTFVRDDGSVISLLNGYRDFIQPGWGSALNAKNHHVPDRNSISYKKEKVERVIRDMRYRLKALDFDIKGKNILEFGCNDGSKLFELSRFNPASMVGSDLLEFYTAELRDRSLDLSNEESYLSQLRETTSSVYETNHEMDFTKIEFKNDDICRSRLKDNSFDLIFSWNVLEHIDDPGGAFFEIHRLLKPGGITFNKYNPFYCQGGGHSLCSLDFPWGHVRLTSHEYRRYLKEKRPAEYEKAMEFYQKGLNRMSISDLDTLVAKSGLDSIAVVAYPTEYNIKMLNLEILRDCKLDNPNISYTDLVSNGVYQIAQKRSAN